MAQSNTSQQTPRELAMLLSAATQCYRQGNLPQAELICRHALRVHGPHHAAYALLGMIALDVDLPDFAVEYLQKAVKANPSDAVAGKNLQIAKKRRRQDKMRTARPRKSPGGLRGAEPHRFLLIKAWGYGFWSDMDHVLSQLLLAEITGRIPVVHWGDNSLFRDSDCDNAYELYYQPVSAYGIHDLLEKPSTYFPSKWTQANLLANDVNKWEGPDSRMAGLYLLHRAEDVVVSDFHTYLNDLVPWIRKGHPLHALDPEEIYRYLFRKYVKLKPDIAAEIEQFWEGQLQGRSILAVHVRGSDKFIENERIRDINNSYHERIGRYLDTTADGMIFLLTDSQGVVEKYRQEYGEKLIYSDCVRTRTDTGVHNQAHSSRRKIGVEVIKDVYLAARCDYFLGNGRSNVSTTVLHLQNWDQERCTLIGKNTLFQPQFLSHKR